MEGRSTRSRVTLPDDILQVGQASPFKKARSQKRNRANTSSTTSSTEPTASEDQSQDGGEPPPRDNEEHVTDGKFGKRSASPPRQDGYGRSTTPNEGRELKRLKTGSSLDGLDTEKPQRESRFLARVKSVTSQKPRSIGHRPNSPPPSPPLGRATSVPIFPSEYSLPQIDLRHPPPSPSRGRSRSPSKSTTPKLTMIPLPSTSDSNDFAQGSPEEMNVDTPDVPAEVLLPPPPPQEPSTAPSDETLPSINGVHEQSLAKPVSPKVNFSEVVGIKQLETPIVSQDNWLHGVSPLTPAETPRPSTLQATQAPSESVAPLNKLPEKKPIPAPKFTSKLASNLKKAPSAVPSSSSNSKTVAKLPPKAPSFNPLKSATLGKGVASGSKEQPKISDWMVKRTPKPVFSASSSRESSRAPPGRVKTAMKPKQRKEARKSTIPPPLVPLPDEAEDNLAQPPLGDGMATRESAPQSEPEEPSAPSLTAVDETPIDAETAVESQALEADTPGAHSHPVDGYAVLQEPSQVTEHPMTTPVQRAEEPVAPNEPQPVAQSAEEPVVLDEHQPILDDTPASAPAAQPAEETIVPDGPQPMPDDTPAPAAQPAEEPVTPEPRPTPSSALQATEPLDSRDPQITLEQPTPDPGPLLGGEQPMVDVEMGDADVEGKVENGVQPQACDNLPKDPRRSGRSRLPVPRHPSTVASTSRLTRTTRSSSLKQVEKVSKAPEPPRGRQPVSKAPKRAASRARSRAASVAATRAPAEQSEPPASGSSEAAPIGAFDFSKTLDEAPVEVDTNQPNEGRSRANSTGSPMRVASPVRQSPRLRTSISSPTLKPKTPLASPSKSRIPVKRTHSPSPARLVRSASLFSVRPPSRLRDDGSALSSLSNALEKLRKPAPSRPNTSMGFNPDRSDNDMDGPSSSKPHSVQDDSNVGKVSSAALKGKTPAPLGKTSSFGPQHNNKAKFIFPVASGSKPMKQSTLLFGKPGIGRGRPFGVGLGRAPKASRNPGLATVIGSPVKGGGSGSAQEEAMDEDMEPVPSGSAVKIEESPFLDTFIPVEPSEKSKGKQREKGDFTTRRASTVSASLSESIVAFREENAKGKGLMGPPAVPERLSARSAGSSGSPGGVGETSSTPPGRRSTRNAAVAAVAANHAILTKKPAESPKSPVNEALKFLKDCVIYVDVKTEDSEEAGSLFVEMLEGVGARILKQVGQTCTHIVYKNGLQSTINKYNLLRDPKPLVVGIAWVVDCVEQRKKVAEKEYLIDLDEVSLLTNPHKRRRSLLPKPISRSFSDVSMFTESSSRDEPQDGDVSMESTSSVGLDDLTPLERARRRKSMLIGN